MTRRDTSLNLAPATVRDWREEARRALPRQLFDYIDGGANEELTMRANEDDLSSISLRQRVMRDVDKRKTATTVLGQPYAMPVILAPVGLGGMFAKRAEVQAARAADKVGAGFCESTVSICSIEEVAAASVTPIWFQLYVMRDRGYAESLMKRACDAGCEVLVLTVDLAVVGARYRDVRNGMVGSLSLAKKLRRGIDLVSHPGWIRSVALGGKPLTFGNLEAAVPDARNPTQFRDWVDSQFDPSVTWEDIAWVRKNWKGKLVVKGLLEADDARAARDAGVDGVVVSNHGGRQLDSVPSSVSALPAVVEAVGEEVEVLADGGVRSGIDVVKMLCLGAKAVLVGRAWAWAVAGGGEAGVRNMLNVLRYDIDTALGLTGCTDVAELSRRHIIV